MALGRFAGRRFYGEIPNKYTTALRGTEYAAALDQLGAQPRPLWLSSHSGATTSLVDGYLDKAGPDLGAFVVYFRPKKDNGSYSSGGAAPDARAYGDAIQRIAIGIAGRPCVVIIEPDGTSMACDRMTAADQMDTETMLSDAVRALTAAGAAVYLDAGSSNWIPADEMAEELLRCGIGGGAGFALNTSGTRASKDEHAYAQAIRAIVGADKGYGIDTGRNGLGAWDADNYEPGDPYFYSPTHPDYDDLHWLNSPGRGIGARPTTNVSQALYPGCDWLQWVKSPGGSDGDDHRGHLPAGGFDPYEALSLRARARPAFPKV